MKAMMSQEEAKRQLDNLFGSGLGSKKEEAKETNKTTNLKLSKPEKVETDDSSQKRRRIVIQEKPVVKKAGSGSSVAQDDKTVKFNKKTKGVPVPSSLAADLKSVVDAGFFSTRELGLKVGYSNTTAAPRMSEIVRGRPVNVTRKRLLKLEALAKTYLNKMKVLEKQSGNDDASISESAAGIPDQNSRIIDVEVENKLATNVPMFSDDKVPNGLFASSDRDEQNNIGIGTHAKADESTLPEKRFTICTDAEIREIALALKKSGIRARLEIDIDDWS